MNQPNSQASQTLIGPPNRQLGQYTTSELQTYRRELERAIKTMPDTAPVRANLRRWLADVEAEEQDRAKLAGYNLTRRVGNG